MASFSSSSSHNGCMRMLGAVKMLLIVAAMCSAVVPGVTGQESVCGTKFSDPASSAFMAPVVLQGQVERLDPMSSSSSSQNHHVMPGNRGMLYQAGVKVRKVYKGKELMEQVDSEALSDVMVEGIGEEEDKEECVGRVTMGQSYLFFLQPQVPSVSQTPPVLDSTASPPSFSATSSVSSGGDDVGNVTQLSSLGSAFVITALPLHMELKALKTVKKALCPGCAAVPIIKHVKCKNCATPPVLKRPMSAKDKKTIRAGRRLSLRCVARGNPKPSYTWLKDRRVVHHSSERSDSNREGRSSNVFRSGTMTIRYAKQFSLLVVNLMRAEDAGTYTCLAFNAMGEVTQSVEVKVKGQQPPTTTPRPSPTTTPPFHPDHDLCPDPPCEVMTTPPPPSPTLSPSSDGEVDDDDDDDPCAVNPCYNSGSCFRDGVDGLQAHCQCLPDYHGNKCQFRRRVVAPDEDSYDDFDDNVYDEDGVEDDSIGSRPLDADDHPDIDALPSDNANHSISDHSARDDTISSSSDNNTITTTPNILQPTSDINLPRSSVNRIGRRISKKRTKNHQGGSHSKVSKTGAPKLQVSECPEQGYCLNGGRCKIVVQLQRKFCDCAVGYGGRRCERVL